MRISKFNIFFLVTFSFFYLTSLGQDASNRYSEEDVKFEESFIEGLALKTSGEAEEALKIFENLLEVDRRNVAVLYEIARIQKIKGNGQEAIQTIERAIRIDQKEVWFHLFKAGIQEQMNDYAGAAETYHKIIDLDPYNSQHVFRQTDHFLKVNLNQSAIEALDAFEDRVGPHEGVFQRRYDIYKLEGEQKMARNQLELLVNLYPSNIDYLYLLAGEFITEGQLNRADSLLNRILEIDPTDSKASMALAGRKKSDSSPETYILSLEKIFKEPTAELDPKVIEIIPFVESLNNRQDTALTEALLTAISWIEMAHPKEAKVKAIRADVYQLSNDYENAIEAYKDALKYEKGVYSVWEQLLFLLKREARYEELDVYTEQALDVFPNQIKLWLLNAYSHRKMENYDNALDALEQAEFMAFDNEAIKQEIAAQRGAIYFEKGDKIMAMEMFDDAIKEMPQNYIIHCRKSIFLARGGHHDKAIQQLEDIAKMERGKELATATMGVLYYHAEQKDKARSHFENIDLIAGQSDIFSHVKALMDDDVNKDQLLDFWLEFLENIVASS